jgi:hypothetical protein
MYIYMQNFVFYPARRKEIENSAKEKQTAQEM